jgi:segregation and condensation protein B
VRFFSSGFCSLTARAAPKRPGRARSIEKRISAIRGVNGDGVVRTLVTRGLIEETGHDHETGAHLYRTTNYFLERLGLKSLEELPPIAAHLPMPDNVEEVLDLVNN